MPTPQSTPSRVPDSRRNAELQALLDHIAMELAEEYVRLMEAATAVDRKAAGEETAMRPSETGR